MLLMDQDPNGQAKARENFFAECRTFARAMSQELFGV